MRLNPKGTCSFQIQKQEMKLCVRNHFICVLKKKFPKGEYQIAQSKMVVSELLLLQIHEGAD